jgi:hypothetical protein
MMNPYEAPQTNSPYLPVAEVAKQLRTPWHNNRDFFRRNRLAMILNCLLPWLIATMEIVLARPRTGWFAFDFVPGIIWLVANAAWLGCLLGLSWSQRRQFVHALFGVLLVGLNFAAAVSFRYAPLLTMPATQTAKFSGNYSFTLLVGSIWAGIVLVGSFVLMLLLQFRSRLVDSRHAESEGSVQSSYQWSLSSMIYWTFLVAAATLGITYDQQWGSKEPFVYLFPLFILLFWHELMQHKLRWSILFAVLAFGVVLLVINFRKYPLNTANLRNELEFWLSFLFMTFAIGLTARWAGWRIIKRPPLRWKL